MVQNAVAFLQHPQARALPSLPARRTAPPRASPASSGARARLPFSSRRLTPPPFRPLAPPRLAQVSSSPESTKRAFLEKKGLTGDEIEEAFRRAPEPAAKTAGAPPAAKPAPPTTSSAARTPPAAVPGRAADRHPESESGPRWTQVLLRAGFFAAAASWAYKNVRGGQSGAGQSAPGPAARRDEGSRDDANARETNAANAQGPNSATKPREDGASPDPSHRSFVAASARAAELETSLERAKSEAESFRSLLAAARTSADASAAAGAGTFPEITRAVESVARERARRSVTPSPPPSPTSARARARAARPAAAARARRRLLAAAAGTATIRGR